MQTPRSETAGARTGVALRKEAHGDKSSLGRLPVGEWFDAGDLVTVVAARLSPGLIAVCLSITQLWMRRPNLTRPRRIFWPFMLGVLVAVAPRAQADSPFSTDDPQFSPGWEIKTGLTGEDNSGGSVLTEVLDWNYAVVPNVRLNLTTYTKHVWPEKSSQNFGYGDTEFKIKWRFLDEDAEGALPALGIAPKVFIPTAADSHGLGDGVWRFQVPLQFAKTTGHWFHFAEAGYLWAFDPGASDSTYGGAGTLYSFNREFALGTELFGTVPTDITPDWQLLSTLGAVYAFSEHWALKASVSKSLRAASRGGPNPSGVFYVVWNFE